MKIVHVCLAALYVEGFGYQENILTQEHRRMGLDVTVLTNDRVFNSKYEYRERDEKDYVNEYGVHVIVLRHSKRYPFFSRYNDYEGVYDALEKEKPNIIFVHGGQFLALKDVVRYCKNNLGTAMYIDQHADYYNTPVDSLKSKFAHTVVFGHWMRKAAEYTRRFWGVTPWRCEYLRNVYRLPKEKIGLLVMGGEDGKIEFDRAAQIRKSIRKELGLQEDDFVIVTGGKIDKKKNIHLLLKAVSKIDSANVKIIVFGQPTADMENEIAELSKDSHVRNIGWLKFDKVYDYFLTCDLAVFPGTHSVLWEQACACGIPCVFKDWEGMHHVDLGGNCLFLREDSVEEIAEVLLSLISNKDMYAQMKANAKNGIDYFSYKRIAKQAIEK